MWIAGKITVISRIPRKTIAQESPESAAIQGIGIMTPNKLRPLPSIDLTRD